jgi:hypothetical protein
MEGLRGIIDHLQLRLAGDTRHGMEALGHRSCRWFRVGIRGGRSAVGSSRKHCTRFQISCCGRTGFRERRVSARIPLPRSAGIRLPGVRFPAQVDRVRQSQHVFDGIAGVVGSHEPTGSWWATRLGPGGSLPRAVPEDALCQQRQRNRFASLLRLDDLHCHALTLSKHADPRLLDH